MPLIKRVSSLIEKGAKRLFEKQDPWTHVNNNNIRLSLIKNDAFVKYVANVPHIYSDSPLETYKRLSGVDYLPLATLESFYDEDINLQDDTNRKCFISFAETIHDIQLLGHKFDIAYVRANKIIHYKIVCGSTTHNYIFKN